MRVAIADDSVLFREGLALVLEEMDFEVVAQVSTGDDLLALVEETCPDLAILDIRMPPTFTSEGIAAAAVLADRHPEVGVLVLSHYMESDFAMSLLADKAAGRGYLLKDRVGDLEVFGDSLRRVGEGGSVVDPEVVAALVGRQSRGPLDDLTAREREILTLMAEGYSNKGICEKIFLSPRTVEAHIRAIFQKLGVEYAEDQNRRVLAVLAYLRANT